MHMTESIMSRNFVHYGSGGSEYTDAMLAAQRARNSMAARQMGILATGKAMVASLGPDAGYADITRMARKAGRLMEEEKDTATNEASERNLEAQKEDIEKRAQEALTGSEDGALSPDALDTDQTLNADAADADAQDAADNEAAAATDTADQADDAVKTTEELLAEQQAAGTAGNAAAASTRQSPFHLVI